jgi:16S rRNA (uracil1498-N3)-methyltransferase
VDVFWLGHRTPTQASLTPDESRHCSRVLRHRAGDVIGAIDGAGQFVSGPITNAVSEQVTFAIETEQLNWGEPTRTTTLVVPNLAHRDRLEWLVEKAVELGLTELVLIQTARTTPGKVALYRIDRIMRAALKQSQRSRLPTVLGPLPFAEALAQSTGLKLLGWCEATAPLPQAEVSAADHVTIAIGPEGDFTADEVYTAEQAGFRAITLGQSRLRVETAALHALSMAKGLRRY